MCESHRHGQHSAGPGLIQEPVREEASKHLHTTSKQPCVSTLASSQEGPSPRLLVSVTYPFHGDAVVTVGGATQTIGTQARLPCTTTTTSTVQNTHTHACKKPR